jgi:hypothetical protein
VRFEHFFALFRPFRINASELKATKRRANVLGAGSGIDAFVRGAEALILTIETKAGTLLTHISMMIAVTGLMLATSSESLSYEVLLAGELTIYLLLALLCIRCQSHFGTNSLLIAHEQHEDSQKIAPRHIYQDVIFGELFYREWLFRLIQIILYVLTFVLIFTVLYGLLADELGAFLGEKSKY